MNTQMNLDHFYTLLTEEYTRLFATDEGYSHAASQMSPSELARKMTLSLDRGSGNKDGKGVKRVCKALGIPHTYKAIRSYLQAQ